MIAKLSLTTGTSVRDLSHRGNRLGMSKREAILAINELIRAGLAKKAKMSSRLPSSVRRMETWYYLTDKGHEEFRNLYLSSSTNGPLYAAV